MDQITMKTTLMGLRRYQGLHQSTQDGFTQDVYQEDLITYSYRHLVISITAFPSSKSEPLLLCHQELRTSTESASVNRNAATGIAASIH